MDKTVCELFAGVGGFRLGLGSDWNTVWFNQWEPNDKKTQWAYSCYCKHFGIPDREDTNIDIHLVDKNSIPDFNLLVGGFPCQDYSVASTLVNSKGIEGKKGILWWDIRDVLECKNPPFVLLENVDRLLKSPSNQRGRDFGIILACFRDLGYSVEWKVINAADYGLQQRRKRVFIFAHKNNIETGSFFDKVFESEYADSSSIVLPDSLKEISDLFKFEFQNSGSMKDGLIQTRKYSPVYNGNRITLGDILEENVTDRSLFIPIERVYYTDRGGV